MKKFLLFLTLFLSAVGIATAAEQSYTFTGYSNKSLTAGEDNTTWSSSTAPKATDNNSRGLQWGNSNAKPGTFTISSSVSFSNVTKVSLVVASTAQSSIDKIEVGGTDIVGTQNKTFKTSSTNTTTLEFSSSAKPSGTITITITGNNQKALFVKTITITTEDGGTSGGDTAPNITWTLDETALAEGAAVSAKLGETNVLPKLSFANGAPVTCKSSNEAVATVADDGKVTILAAGTTTITASTPANDATFKQASKSYKLTVIDPSNPVILFNFAELFGTTANVDFSNGTKKVDGASITCKDGGTKTQYYSSDNTLRLYANGTITVAAPTGYYVTKIVFTSADWSLTCEATNGTLSGKTWTYTEGKTTSNSVTFKATAKTFFKTITVYCAKDSNLKDAEFAFAETNVNKWVDDAAFTNTLTYAEGITDGIVYSIENPQDVTVAEINASTGEVTIKGVGTATITATREEDATFKKGEASYTLVVSKHPHGLVYSPASVSLEPGEELASQPTLKNDNTLVVTYSSSNEAVATVTDDGTISLAGATGQAVISATFAGNKTYEAGSATFTITVREAVYADAIYTLVTDVNDIQAGDIVVIAANGKAMSCAKKSGNIDAIDATISEDKSTLNGAANILRLQVEKTTDGFFMFRTVNYEDGNGYLICGTGKNNNLKVNSSSSDKGMAFVTINSEGTSVIFNKGTSASDTNRNILQLNLINNANIFACYQEAKYTAVSIYRATSHPATIEAQIDEPEFVESSVKLTNLVQLSKEATANNYAVLINGTQVGVFAKDSYDYVYDYVTVELTNAPYLPEAKYTICPVLAEDTDGNPTILGHPEELTFTFPTLPTFEVTAMTPKWYYQKFYTEAGETYANLDLWIYMTPSVTTTLSYTFAEFADSEVGKEIWGWYDETQVQLQNCKYNFLTKVPVTGSIPVVSEELLSGKEATATFTPVFLFNVDSKYSSLISGSTRAAAPALLGEETPILVQEVNGTKISESIEIKKLSGAEVSGVESVVVEGVDGAVEYYNMQGVRVEGELAPGMYIRRQGRSVSKVQIR